MTAVAASSGATAATATTATTASPPLAGVAGQVSVPSVLVGPPFAAFLARPRPLPASGTAEKVAHPGGRASSRSTATHTSGRAPASRGPALAGEADMVDDPLDPLHRRHAALQPPQGLAMPLVAPAALPAAEARSPAASHARTLATLEHLLPAFVRRVAWSGDGRRGTARLEIGAGELTGAVLQIDADEGRVRVHLDVPSGADPSAWRERIERSLRDRNLPTDSVEVT